jgi:hypothetical protein
MKTESNSRAQEVAASLMPAYQKASRLRITKSEAKKLTKPFPDKDVEIRPDNGALYLPHILLSQRLNETFSPGSWALICRAHEYIEDAQMIRAEHILLIKGCFVGEAVGEHKFNSLAGEKYGDGLEATAAEALRRICGKRLSCGNQLWQPVYCSTWQTKFAETFQADVYERGENRKVLRWRKKGSVGTVEALSETPLPAAVKWTATDDDRFVMLQCLSTVGKANVLKFAIAEGILKEGQTLEDWPLDQVPNGERGIRALETRIAAKFAPQPVKIEWQDALVPFGSMKGKRLGEVEKSVLAGYWEAFDGQNVNKSNPVHVAFKKALDSAAKHFNLTKPKTHSKK